MAVFATGPNGESLEPEIADDGSFSFPASVGEWSVEARNARSGEVIEHRMTLDQAPARLSTIAFGREEPEPLESAITLIDFEDVTRKDIREMPNGVGGLSWWNFVCLEVDISYTNNAVSGYFVAYNSSGHPGRIYHDEPFDFEGGFFGVAWQRANGEWLRIQGWRGEEQVYEDWVRLSNLGPVWFDADYRGITRLDLQTEHYWQFVTDDLAFRLPED